ncbi:MAG: sigma-70 family RNA polymerase sigma factor [Ardenticatenaceae bacterium]|nr:sigma-70 family RNA polymerase sigma factor [Ardenticatenaceae bacterium]MCB8948262.1 sigma-70 family RNA polymerase sigma factor [Ardenticatenaceae bacterium]
MNELSDEQLMTGVINRDMTAYKTLYERYKRSVLGLSYKILRDQAAAEEVMQETFWRIWNNASSFNNQRGTFPNWMFGIARNLSIDIVRRGQKIKMQALPDMHLDHVASSPQYKAEHDVADAALSLLQHEQVHLAMTTLPEEQREVVEWIYFQGKTRRQIAQEHDIPFGTINTRARLALDKLKRALQAQGFEE